MGLAIGTVSGVATRMRSAYKAGENPWTGEKVHGHHSDPIFMGGDPNQKLTRMDASDHRQLHKDLNDFLYEQKNSYGDHMRPQSNNSGVNIQNNFSRPVRVDAMKQFYDTYKWTYPGARYDFYRNNNIPYRLW